MVEGSRGPQPPAGRTRQAGARSLADRLEQRAVAPAARNGAAKTVFDLIESQRPQIARALPRHMDPDRMVRILMTCCRTTPRLLECTPESLLGAAMLAAQLGLEPGPLGHAYLVPFRNARRGTMEVAFIPGYRGYVDLMWRSGRVLSVFATDVAPEDEFDWAYGLEPKLYHRPSPGTRSAPTHFYGIVRLKDGGYYYLVLSRDQVEQYRQRSKSPNEGPWVTDYVAMACKTVFRRMAPWLPMSPEFARAVAAEDATTTRYADPDLADTIDTTGEALREAPAGAPEPAAARPAAGDGRPVDPDTGEVGGAPAPTLRSLLGDGPAPREPGDDSGEA